MRPEHQLSDDRLCVRTANDGLPRLHQKLQDMSDKRRVTTQVCSKHCSRIVMITTSSSIYMHNDTCRRRNSETTQCRRRKSKTTQCRWRKSKTTQCRRGKKTEGESTSVFLSRIWDDGKPFEIVCAVNPWVHFSYLKWIK